MSILRAFTLILLVFGTLGTLPAQEITDDAKFTFPAPPEVVIKLKKSSKSSVKGSLVSLTKLEAVITNDKGEQRVSFDRIDSLKTALLQFDGEDDYAEICQKVKAAYSSVELSSASSPAAEPHRAASVGVLPGSAEAMQKQTAPKVEPAKSGLGQGGFGGINNIAKPKAEDVPLPEDPASETAKPTAVLPGSAEALASTETEVYLCDKCKKEITSGDLRAGKCPHCKTEFAVAIAAAPAQGTPANPFGAPKPVNGNANPFAVQNGQQAQPAAVNGGPVPAPPVAGPVIQSAGNGFTFDSIPNWAKGGLFVLIVLVGYHVVFNR